MASGQLSRPPQQPNQPPAANQTQRPRQVQMPPPPRRMHRAYRPQYSEWLLRFWLKRTMEVFEQLILVGETQSSNGTVRKVCPPSGNTTFAVAYGDAPDNDLRDLLKSIHDIHGEVTLGHDGRDSTGKHWITCFSKVTPGTFERPILKAVICVFSNLEMATMPQPRPFSDTAKGKAIDDWLDSLPAGVNGGPEDLSSLPWREQLPWLEPAKAKALKDKMEAEAFRREHVMRMMRKRRRG